MARYLGVRNDMADILQIGPTRPTYADRECGNGVVIQHKDGFETQYCHMARGSITVTPGQSVDCRHSAWSGRAVRANPIPTSGNERCAKTAKPLTRSIPTARPPAPIQPHRRFGLCHWPHRRAASSTSGLPMRSPHLTTVKAGTANTGATSDGPAMVAWVHLFGPRDGDTATDDDDRPKRRGVRDNPNAGPRSGPRVPRLWKAHSDGRVDKGCIIY